jgi:hypothetical protein
MRVKEGDQDSKAHGNGLKNFRRRRWKLAFRSQRRLNFLAKIPIIFDIVNSFGKKYGYWEGIQTEKSKKNTLILVNPILNGSPEPLFKLRQFPNWRKYKGVKS